MTTSSYFKLYYPGAALILLLSVASIAIAHKYAAPVMLFAILIGLALHPCYESKNLQTGIDFCARPLLLTGVALLGFRVNFHDFVNLGIASPLITLACLVMTIVFGILFAKVIGVSNRLAILISGSVAICGVSAAAAISSSLPNSKSKDIDLSLTVAGVTVMSTLSMLIYPMLSDWLQHSELQAGVFLGSSIHDVAQVVGAGYSVSNETGNNATLIKLLRVSALLPVVLIISLSFRKQKPNTQSKFFNLLPPFLVIYIFIAILNSYNSLVAIGLRTNIKSITDVGKKPLILLISTTCFLALTSLFLINLFT